MSSTEENTEGTLSTAQAAHRAGVSRWTILRAINARKLPWRKGNRYDGEKLIDPWDLDAWMESRRKSTLLPLRTSADAPPLAPPAPHPAEAENTELRVDNARISAERDGYRDRLADRDAECARLLEELAAVREEMALGTLGRAVRAVRKAWRA